MKRAWPYLLVVGALLAMAAGATAAAPGARVGIVLDGPSSRFDKVRELIVNEVTELARGEFNVQFPEDKTLTADWTREGVNTALDKLMSDAKVDLVLTIGVIGSDVAIHHRSPGKPLIAPFVLSRQLQKAPYVDGASGVKNLTYITYPFDLARDLKLFRRIASFERLSFIADAEVFTAVPAFGDALREAAAAEGVQLVAVPLGRDAKATLARLDAKTQAVLLGAVLRLDDAEFSNLIDGLNARKLPSFAISGRPAVERGVLAASASSTDMLRVARRVALNIQRILLGERPQSLEVDLPGSERLVINMATARAIGLSPTWSVLRDADQIGMVATPAQDTLSLESVVQEAVAKNLDIAIAERAVAAGAENVPRARSALLPQIGFRGEATHVDDERARAVPGLAERTSSGSLTLSQLIYGESRWANFAVQQFQQTAREADRDGVRLDIVLSAVNGYLDVLSAKSNERIEQHNVELTRANRDTAQLRRRVGTATPAEVYRWDSELAKARGRLLQRQAETRVVEIALNRLLRRPLEERFTTVEAGLDDPTLLTSHKQLFALTDRPATYARFGDFMVEEGLLASPEMRQIDALINAQERTLSSTKAAFWQPEINLRADQTRVYSRSGAGSDGATLGDDSQSTVSVQLSLPLFTSGLRSADMQQAFETLEQLRLQRLSTRQQVTQNVRSRMETVRAAYGGIRFAREAAQAAKRNYEIVNIQYMRGAASIILLLDAQNNWITADQAAANAVYDFLKQLMALERAVSRFDFFVSRDDQVKWFERAERYIEQTRQAPDQTGAAPRR